MRTEERDTKIQMPPVSRPGVPNTNGNSYPSLSGTSNRRRSVALLIALGIFIASFFLNSFRLAENSDLKSDEATYVIESVSFNQTGITKWNGGTFLVHPPLFFVIEGLYFKALGIGNSPLFERLADRPYRAGEALLSTNVAGSPDEMLSAINAGRYLSALYGALIAVSLFFAGSLLLNRQVGLLASLLFMLDPYVVWRNHFNYLEPLATLFATLMIMAYLTVPNLSDARQRRWRLLAVGLLLGLALLTKELIALYFAPFIVHALLFRRIAIREMALVLGSSLSVYAIFPLWSAFIGEFDDWAGSRTWLFQRLIGSIKDTGITRPGAPLRQTLNTNLLDYWPWILLLGVTALLTALFLYLYFRRGLRDAPAELLASFVIGSYGFFGVVRLLGGVINEHFFYLLMPVPALTVAYAVAAWPRLNMLAATASARQFAAKQTWAEADGGRLRFGEQRNVERAVDLGSTLQLERVRPINAAGRIQRALLAALLLLSAYNVVGWVLRYGLGSDNSYAQVSSYLARTLPPGTSVVGRDLLDLYLLPKNNVYTFSYLNLVGKVIDPTNLIDREIPYAILNEQSLIEGYGGANQTYYDWVKQYSEPIYHFAGRRYNTSVHKLDYARIAMATIGEDSIAVEKPSFASSSEERIIQRGGNFRPEFAFDGLASTRWASDETDNEWIYVDLGESRSISRVELRWENAFAQRYELQVSDNARDWRTFYGTDQGAGGLEVVTAPATGRYVRLLMTQRGTEFGYSLWEISVYP